MKLKTIGKIAAIYWMTTTTLVAFAYYGHIDVWCEQFRITCGRYPTLEELRDHMGKEFFIGFRSSRFGTKH